MAHENIDQRRLWVAERYNEGAYSAEIIDNGLKLFDCSHSAIYADLKHFGFPHRKSNIKIKNIRMKNPGVYCLIFFDGSIYIGASNNPHSRFLNHLCLLRNGKHKCKIMQELFSVNDDIEFKILIHCQPFELLQQESIQIQIFMKSQSNKILNKYKTSFT